jgi:hypothetical protein
MKPGEVLAGRFELTALAGRGGMGTILRAHDRLTGEPVAVKILSPGARAGVDRFLQEARTLAELVHPSIVRYVAHGLTPEGDPYLAMEWLEGEDLSHRLARQALGAAEAIAVVASAAEGLSVAHAAGIVHRDVKPGNVFLVGRDPGRVKLLDFGVARLFEGGAGLTRTGAVVGTAGYMAPEQARGQRTIDARADVFALGCVLFECLTGRPAFAGDHAVAILAKVLREEVPPIRALRPEAPEALDDLCARMLAKDPPSRPADGAAVLRELRALPPLDLAPLSAGERRSSITGSEQRLLTVMLLVVDAPATGATSAPAGTTGTTTAPSAMTGATSAPSAVTGATSAPGGTTGATVAPSVSPDRATVVLEDSQTSRIMAAEITHRFGSELVSLLDGSMLISSWGGSASDLAIRSAACALAFSARFPGGRIGLTMGRGESSSGLPFGPLIDEAARRLPPAAGIALDPTLAGLLDARFLVEEGERGPMLRGYSDDAGMRTLLGKPTPCVGREKELAQLEAVWAECTGESVARVVLVTGPPGAGKSRLQHELLSRVRRRGDVTVLLARLSAIAATSAFALARQLVQQAAGVREGMPQDEQFVALEHHLRSVAPAAEVPRLAELLGELLGAPTTHAPSPPLRAARSDPRILHDAIKRAFEDWLAAEVATRPLLVVLEDLHFADPASVAFLDEALRRLAERPWMVLALARPEVHDAFPRLWTAHDPQEIPLGKLTRRAAERLVRAALGDDVDPATLLRIVERADGNAFYLEELIRSVATARSDELPATVLAMVQSRLERLEPEARRALRAASIFGEVFWSGGVAALLSGRAPTADAADWLRILRDRELLQARAEGKFPGETEYAFRHALLRDGAYAMLTEADRTAGHRGAAAWLEAHGEGDAVVLADHFVRGDEPVRARPWLLRAARAAVRGGLYEHSVDLAQRAVDLGASGEELADLLVTQGLSLGWRGRWADVLDVSRRAVPCARQSSASFYLAAAGVFFAEAFTGTGGESVGLAMTVAASSPPPDAASSFAFAVQMVVMGGLLQGQKEVALALLDRLELRAREADVADDLLLAGWLGLARTYASLWAHGDLGRALADAEAASSAFAAAGDVREGGGTARLFAAVAAGEAGLLDEAEAGLRATVDAATTMGARFLLEWGSYYLARVEIQRGRHAGALERLRPLCASSGMVARMAQAYSALALHEMGRFPEAEAQAGSPLLRSNAVALTLRLRAARAHGDADALREIVPKVDRFLHRDVMSPLDNTRLALEWVLALRALGDTVAAAAAAEFAHRRVARIAASLGAHRGAAVAFREAIPENARALALGEG